MFPIVGTLYQDGFAKRAAFENAGVPTNGTTGTLNGKIGVGSLLIDTTNGGLYINTGTQASPTWTNIGGGGGLVGSLNKQLSVAGAGNGADTTEDTLFTYSLPANTLLNVGNEINIEAWGSVAATSATKTVKLYFGTTVTQSFAYTTTQTGNWRIGAKIIKQAASVQLADINYDALGATTTRSLGNVTNGSETDTAAITIKITGQSTAATANLVLCNGFTITGAN